MQNRMRLQTLLTLALFPSLAAPQLAHAAHPFATDDPGTLGARAAELELGVEGGQGSECDHHGHFGGGVAIHVGVLDSLDVGVGLGYLGLGRPEGGMAWGVGAPALDVKWRFLDQSPALPSLALRLDWGAPVHEGDAFSGHDLGLHLLGSWEQGLWFTSVDLGLLAAGVGSSDPGSALVGSASVLRAVGTSTSLGLEFVGEGHSTLDGIQGLVALLWTPDPATVVSLGAGPAWGSDEALGWSAAVGFTFSFAGVHE